MRKLKKVIAGTLIAAMILSLATACNGGGEVGKSDSSSIQLESWNDNSLVNQEVSKLASSMEDDKVEVDTKLVWMAWGSWKIDETTPAAKLFKTVYGTPEKENEHNAAASPEDAFANILVAYGERYTELAKRVQSGEAPDIFPFEINNYPFSIYKKLFQPVDEIFDFSEEKWSDYKDVIDDFKWGGKTYCPIYELNVADLLWYRTPIVDDAGLDDPWQLFEDGKWDWDTFLNMCRDFRETGSDCYALDGYNPENAMVCTTGTGLINLQEGKLVSNLNSGAIEKCMELLTKFNTEDIRYPLENNGFSPDQKAFVNGKTLFYEDGTWRYDETWSRYVKAGKWEEDEIRFVPFPRMTGSDEYYQMMKQDSIMLVSGSKNINGYKAWITANLNSSKDAATALAGREQLKEKFQWSDINLDRLDLLKKKGTFTPVFDFKNGIGQDIASTDTSENIVENLTKHPYVQGISYTQIRSQNQGTINARIDELNKSIS